jgi:hypothetical protein
VRPGWYDGGIVPTAPTPTRVLAAAALALALAACGDDPRSAGEARADQVRDAAEDAGLPGDVADVLAAAAAGVDGTFRVTYELEGGTVVVTQRPPDRRIETASDDGSVDVLLTAGGRAHACTDPPGPDGWTCEDLGSPPDEGVFDAADVEAFSDALAGGPGVELAVEARDVAGTPTRCIVSSPTPATLCVAESGAILPVERPSGTLRAAAHTTDIPADAFDLPS